MSESEWSSQCGTFINSVCAKLSLPSWLKLDEEPKPEQIEPKAKRVRSATRFEDAMVLHTLDVSWASPTNRFLMVVDCKPLKEVVCGHTAVSNEHYVPIFKRIVDNIMETISLGWLPPQSRDDPILWVPRNHNKIADFLCNKTMDERRSWRRERSFARSFKNVLAFSDGGARNDCAASAWVIGVCVEVSGKMHFEPVIVEGIYFDPPVHPFQVEAIALECATKELLKWCGS